MNLRRRIASLASAIERLDDSAYREIEEEIERLCRHHRLTPVSIHAVLTLKEDNTMAPSISVDSTTATLSVSFLDDKGDATSVPDGTTVTYSGDNDAVATVDPATGHVTPVAIGSFNAVATVANADGSPSVAPDGITPLSPAAVTVSVDPSAAVSAVLDVTP